MASLDIKTAFDEASPKHIAKIMESHKIHGWLISALLRGMSGLEGKAMFECVESSFRLNRCLRQGGVEAFRLWQMMAAQLLASVEGKWKQKHRGLLLDFKGEKAHQICSFMWAYHFWIMSHSKTNLEQMLRDLIEEAEKWDLAPKLAILWWTSTHEEEVRHEMIVATNGLMYKFSSEEKFKILGCADIPVYRSKDVPWRIKCKRLVDCVRVCVFRLLFRE